jgi:hypothetical protein
MNAHARGPYNTEMEAKVMQWATRQLTYLPPDSNKPNWQVPEGVNSKQMLWVFKAFQLRYVALFHENGNAEQIAEVDSLLQRTDDQLKMLRADKDSKQDEAYVMRWAVHQLLSDPPAWKISAGSLQQRN